MIDFEALPVAELGEIREKLRRNAEEREALEAAANRLLEQWTEVTAPPSAPVSVPAQVPAVPAIAIVAPPARELSWAERAVLVINSNPEKHFSAMELAQLWNIGGSHIDGVRSALSRLFSRGHIRKVAFGRYTSIYAGRPK